MTGDAPRPPVTDPARAGGPRFGIWWIAAAVLAAAAYLYGLGGLHIPHIGDEMPYAQVTRMTAESGDLLPLQGSEGLKNTKPPLLFWMGIAATSGGEAWTLLRLRLPIVLFTLLTTVLVFHLTRRLSRRRASAWIAALTFLAFWTTFQYGRPFLTNMPETFFVFLPFALLVGRAELLDRWWPWVLTGFSIGVACLFKSFALVAPVGVALAWWQLSRRKWDLRAFLRRDGPKGLLALVIALGCFSLWFALDNDPQAILDGFVLKENLGKVGGGNYLEGLFKAPHSIFTTLFGHPFNAGFMALPLIHLVVLALRKRLAPVAGEKTLWILAISFLVVYSIPSHRQSNYLLPTMPAIAVLLGLHWHELVTGRLRLFAIPMAVVALLALLFVLAVGHELRDLDPYAWWQIALPIVALLLSVQAVLHAGAARRGFHAAVFLVYLAIACATAPFDGPLGRYDDEAQAALAGADVHVPSTFRARYERWRFLLPDAVIKGYAAKDRAVRDRLLEEGAVVAVTHPVGQVIPQEEGARVFGRRLDLRTRHSWREIRSLVLEANLEILLQEETILQMDPPR